MSHDAPVSKLNRREIRVYATVRSGHHGVIEWVLPHFPGEILYRHNVSRIDWPSGPYVTTGYNHASGKLWSRDLYILNVEDADLEVVRDAFADNRWLTKNGKSKRVDEILILRDPYNFFASAYKCFGPFPFNGSKFPSGDDLYVQRGSLIGIWKQHAREFLKPSAVPGAIHVNFTTWMRDVSCRKALAESLDLEFTDAGFGVRGMHSSFDGKFDDARKLMLFDRWRAFEADPTFRKFFDDEIHDLATKIFGESVALPKDALSG